jgi:hypothetical protein
MASATGSAHTVLHTNIGTIYLLGGYLSSSSIIEMQNYNNYSKKSRKINF